MTAKGRRTWYFLLGGLLLLPGLVAVGAWLANRDGASRLPVRRSTGPHSASTLESPDPRRTYTGPYRNIDPEVRYVGDSACVECHKDIAASYAGHPMGRSLMPIAALADRPASSPRDNPFAILGRRFEVRRQNERMWHRQSVLDESGKPALELVQEIQWAIGSGSKGYSYLLEKDGYILQTPISWFTQKQRWDLSPGFAPSTLAGRVVPASCLFCHTNHLREHPDHPDRFLPPMFEGHAIGCERCHGPGELHVKGDLDHTIVNPARLSGSLSNAVCEQCHLEGEVRVLRPGRKLFDYRPGLPLHEFWTVLVQAGHNGEDARAVNHVEQIYRSKCFQASNTDGSHMGKMGCTTCHDPHVHVGKAKRVANYRAACMKCHDEAKCLHGCSVPRRQRLLANPNDSCIDCHMPRYSHSDIAHAASADHRIVRRADRGAPRPAELSGDQLADFYRDRFPRGDSDAARNLALGLVKLLGSGRLQPQKDGERAVHLLELALARHPRDPELRAGKALVLELLGRSSEALSEARRALVGRLGDWRLLAQAAGAAQAQGKLDDAADYLRQAVEINPFVADNHVRLIALLIRTGQLDEVRTRNDALLQLDPFNVSGRQTRVGELLRQGKKAAARQEFELIRRLKPADLPQREEWFRQQLR